MEPETEPESETDPEPEPDLELEPELVKSRSRNRKKIVTVPQPATLLLCFVCTMSTSLWTLPLSLQVSHTNENFKNNIWNQLKSSYFKAHQIWNIKQITCHGRFVWEKLLLYFYYCRVCPQDGRKVRCLSMRLFLEALHRYRPRGNLVKIMHNVLSCLCTKHSKS